MQTWPCPLGLLAAQEGVLCGLDKPPEESRQAHQSRLVSRGQGSQSRPASQRLERHAHLPALLWSQTPLTPAAQRQLHPWAQRLPRRVRVEKAVVKK